MKIGQVSLHTNDVVRLANFYKELFSIDNGNDSDFFQILINGETQLAVINDDTYTTDGNCNISLSFNVDDIEEKYEKLQKMGARIIKKPDYRPWGIVYMSFYDPDGNVIQFTSLNFRD